MVESSASVPVEKVLVVEEIVRLEGNGSIIHTEGPVFRRWDAMWKAAHQGQRVDLLDQIKR